MQSIYLRTPVYSALCLVRLAQLATEHQTRDQSKPQSIFQIPVHIFLVSSISLVNTLNSSEWNLSSGQSHWSTCGYPRIVFLCTLITYIIILEKLHKCKSIRLCNLNRKLSSRKVFIKRNKWCTPTAIIESDIRRCAQ